MRYSIIFNGINIGWIYDKDKDTLNLIGDVELVPILDDDATYDYLEVWVYGIDDSTYKVLATDGYGRVLSNLEEGVGSKLYRMGNLYKFRGEFYVLVEEKISFGSQGYMLKRINTNEFTELI